LLHDPCTSERLVGYLTQRLSDTSRCQVSQLTNSEASSPAPRGHEGPLPGGTGDGCPASWPGGTHRQPACATLGPAPAMGRPRPPPDGGAAPWPADHGIDKNRLHGIF